MARCISFLADPGYHPPEYMHSLPAAMAPFPEAFVLVIEPRCNMRCSYCCAPNEGFGSPAPVADLLDTADQARAMGKTLPMFLGGEPLLHPGLFELIEGLRARGFPGFGVITNGTRLRDAAFADRLLTSGCRFVVLSYDDFDPVRLDRITRSRGHRAVLDQALDRLFQRIDRVQVFFQVCVVSHNHRFLPDLVRHVADRARGAGVPLDRLGVNLNNLQAAGRALENAVELMVDLAEVVPRLVEAVEVGRELGIAVQVRDFPMCVLPPALEPLNSNLVFKDFLAMDGRIVDWFGTLSAKKPDCARCRYDRWCSGFFPRYAELYGDRLFVPVP